jgi:DNA helicase-2/ATP-dependent DNA helicase PcrA
MPTAGVLQKLWTDFDFKPNDNQRRAILHSDGPLFLPAGPGSGKTRVLLWRVTNLIVTHGVDAQRIYLSTFTEKAAQQLRDGLRAYLAAASRYTGKPYDIGRMYVGTVHSLCQRLITDRQFRTNNARGKSPTLLDDLDQYLFVNTKRNWEKLLRSGDFANEHAANNKIPLLFNNYSRSKHASTSSCIRLFNRLSEEVIDTRTTRARDQDHRRLLKMYSQYRELLSDATTERTDFALLQDAALKVIEENKSVASKFFQHVIIDEYQDTNTVQERLFFALSQGHRNLCVVGDDDQALYRFRGATVENFVQFPKRCQQHFKVRPTEVPLDTNYRSRTEIVQFTKRFIEQCNWKSADGRTSYRVETKRLRAADKSGGTAVVTTERGKPEAACVEIATLVRKLIDSGKVEDPNQIAFLFPSLSGVQVGRMRAALEDEGFEVYAPRAGSFIETAEATAMLGLFATIFGRPDRVSSYGGDYSSYYNWLERAEGVARALIQKDNLLRRFVRDKKTELARSRSDYLQLAKYCQSRGWDLDKAYDVDIHELSICTRAGITPFAQKRIRSARLKYVIRARRREKSPVNLKYVIKRATSIDWTLLDLFYQLTMFEHFGKMFDAAQRKDEPDEGPVCNLALLTQYLSRFLELRVPIIAGDLLAEEKFQQIFFGSYVYALHRRGESEFENAEDPFPKGRIPFLTIHQSKGLEFPVVVLVSPQKIGREQAVEQFVAPLLTRSGREPANRIVEFDIMRMFYVALSRAQNLLVVANYSAAGNSIHQHFRDLVADLPTTKQLNLKSLPVAEAVENTVPKIYSYTGDFLAYERCPRQYLMFRKFPFVPSRSQTMVFGSLVHRTLDDIHQHLISARVAV